MISKDDLINRCSVDGAIDWKQYHGEIEARRGYVQTLERIQNEDYANRKTPDDTVAAFVKAVGYDNAVVTIATLINRSAWDGRISGKNADWAKTIDNALDEKAAVDCDLYADGIHMTHLDQIADKMRKYSPALEAAKKTTIQKPGKEAGADARQQQRKHSTALAR